MSQTEINRDDSQKRELTEAVNAALSGDQQAFRTLYEGTYRDQYYMALRYMQNEQDAADVLQDAYLSAWSHLKSLEDPAKFSSWLSSIVARTSLNALKKQKRVSFEQLADDEAEGASFAYDEADFRREYQPEHAYTDKETSELLGEMIGTLSDEQRACVLMYYIEEVPVKDIADAVGCSENTVKSRLSYGRKNLKAKADELEKKGIRFYGLTAVSFLRRLLKGAASSPETGAAAKQAMERGAAKVLAEGTIGAATSASAGSSAASTLSVKVVAALVGIALIGGGAVYALNRGTAETDTQNEIVWQPVTDMEAALPGSAHPDLDEEVREEFDNLLSLVGETSEARWVYIDEDDFPELLIIDRDAYAEDHMVLYRLYYGENAGKFEGINPQQGITGDLILTTYYDNPEHPNEAQKYYIPHKNTIIEDETDINGETLTIICGLNEEHLAAYRYVLDRRPYDVDVSTGTPQRVDLPEGEYLYYMIDISDPQMEEQQITKEQYDEIIGTDERVKFSDEN